MRWTRSTLALLALIGIVLQSGTLFGISGTSSPCEKYNAASMVFIGTVIAVQPDLPEAERSGQELQVRVEKSFKGVEPGTLVCLYQTAFTDTYKFNLGERWLFYVHSSGLEVRPFPFRALSTPDIDKIDVESDNKALLSGSFYIKIGHYYAKQMRFMEETFLKNLRVSIVSPQHTFELETDEWGYYELFNPIPGKYIIKPDIPSGLKIGPVSDGTEIMEDQDAITIEVGHNTCTMADFFFVWSTKITGRVIDASGLPLKWNPVWVLAAESKGDYSNIYSFTDQMGNYILEGMPPGAYIIFVEPEVGPPDWKPIPRIYYPGLVDRKYAAVITIESGVNLEGYDIQIPKR